MKRVLAVACAMAIAFVGFAAPAQAWDSGSPDGTEPVISGDNFTMCAIRESAMVYCWGANSSGQLGRNTDTAATTTIAPVATYDTTLAQSISVNGSAVCAVLLNRSVQCWGSNALGQVGNGSTGAVVDVPTTVSGLTRVAAVSVGVREACAVRQDGTVWCWGTPTWGTFTGFPTATQTAPLKVTGLSKIVDVSVGQNHACALRVDKRVVCWGQNDYGQLGNGNDDPTSGIVVVPGITDATGMVVGFDNTCAIRTGGTVYCWGNNAVGGLGARTSVAESHVPLKVYGLSSVTSLAMQGYGGCAVAAGIVKCWGSNDLGRLGDGQFLTQYAPVKAVASLPKPTSAWTAYWGSCEVADGGRVWCWGAGSQGRLGNNSTANAYMGTGPGDSFGYAADRSKVTFLASAPGKPTGSSATARKIRITWAAPSTSNGASSPTDYTIQYRLKGTSTWKTFRDSVTSTRSATVTGLSSGKYYQFRVLPKNWAGTGAASTSSSYIKSR